MIKVSDMWEKFNRELDALSDDDYGFLDSRTIRGVIRMSGMEDWTQSADPKTFGPLVAKFKESPALSSVGISHNSTMYLAEISHLVANLDVVQPRVLEVGGGFGNFARVFSEVVGASSYTILDNPSMLRFARKFLGDHDVDAEFVPSDGLGLLEGREFDLFVSNICLSETPEEYRRFLIDKVVPNCGAVFVIDGDGKRLAYNEWLEAGLRESMPDLKVLPFKSPWGSQRMHVGTRQRMAKVVAEPKVKSKRRVKKPKLLLTTRCDVNIKDITDITHPSIKAYAERCGTDFMVLDHDTDGPGDGRWHYRILKLNELYDEYDRILHVDSDVLVTPECPSVFDEVPADKIGTVFEDKGSRGRMRRGKIRLVQEAFGDVDWKAGYINTGFFLTSKVHREIFDKIDGEYWDGWGFDDAHLGWQIAKRGFEVHELSYQWNHMTMFSEEWNGSPDRFDSYVIHYAGGGRFDCDDRMEQMRRDAKVLEER